MSQQAAAFIGGLNRQKQPAQPVDFVTTMGLDTGCCFGGSLTAAVFAEGHLPELCSVPALKMYMPRRNMNVSD